MRRFFAFTGFPSLGFLHWLLMGVPRMRTEILDRVGWLVLGRPLNSASGVALKEFDPDFYRTYYLDLRGLRSKKDLTWHYLRHGKAEGRYKNLAEAIANLEGRFGVLPGDFSLEQYKVFNPDLARVFDADFQYILHYIEHGRREGRIYRVGQQVDESRGPAWVGLFKLSDFIAGASTWLFEVPGSVAEGMHLFIEQGIDRLAPMNLQYVFDPEFYRALYKPDASVGDIALYREWLDFGLSQGRFANQEHALRNLTGAPCFPECFAWRAYRSDLKKSVALTLSNKFEVLEHFFRYGIERNSARYVSGTGSAELYLAIADFHLIRQNCHAVITACNYALAADPAIRGAVHRRGDAHASLGDHVAALADFGRATVEPDCSIWSHLNAARSAMVIGSFDAAFDFLRGAREKWISSALYRQRVVECIDEYFWKQLRLANTLYAHKENRRAADGLIWNMLDKVRGRITELEGLPCTASFSGLGHISILANMDLAQCKHYRVDQKVREFGEAGIPVRVFSQQNPHDFIAALIGARAAIFYRVPAYPDIIRAILTAQALGISTYYEVDDLIFEAEHYPDPFAAFEGQISYEEYTGLLSGVPLFRYAMHLCETGIASTTTLAREIERTVRGGRCVVLRNGLDEKNERMIRLGSTPLPERDTVSIIYGSGTKAHNADFNEIVGPALLDVLRRHESVRLVIVGHLRLQEDFAGVADRIMRMDFVGEIEKYWAVLASADINIAVLAPGLAADCKSEIKWLEASLLQVPSIVSGTATYREVLSDGEDVLIADDTPGWREALERLIVDRELRCRIGAAARRKALRHYALSRGTEVLQQEFGPLFDRSCPRPKQSRAKTRLLVCNVFFPPQTFGGATRVVRDNIDYLRENCPDIDVAVFTTDEGAPVSGRVRWDQYDGLPVCRLSTPAELNMDWRFDNWVNAEIFEQLVDALEPTVIHFHCIQRLTSSIVEVARRKRIPYLVTVHDGWWISDYQFLVDTDGVLRIPTTDAFSNSPPPGIPTLESVARRQFLLGALKDAEHVIAVSPSFAQVYSKAGCPNVIAVPNGVTQLPAPVERRTTSTRLVLGHIGGREVHKGATLIEGILRTERFANLSLIMIDNRMEPGRQIETLWGNTPVSLRGPYAQSRVVELYGALDVLLAPSLWPESYGNVAREARAMGLWVVASDRGAMGTEIDNERDGFVIDVSNGRSLHAILQILDRDYQRFKQAPAQSHNTSRTSNNQGKELAEIYRRLNAAVMSEPAFSGA